MAIIMTTVYRKKLKSVPCPEGSSAASPVHSSTCILPSPSSSASHRLQGKTYVSLPSFTDTWAMRNKDSILTILRIVSTFPFYGHMVLIWFEMESEIIFVFVWKGIHSVRYIKTVNFWFIFASLILTILKAIPYLIHRLSICWWN